MKKIILIFICLLSLFPLNSYSNIEGKWAFGVDVEGLVPLNSSFRNDYHSGLGLGMKVHYGVWSGFSLEGEFEYDRVFAENTSIQADKNLFNLAGGVRYTLDLSDLLSTYFYVLGGGTLDYTNDIKSETNFTYATGLGGDYFVSDDLKIGPLIKARRVNSDPDLIFINFGVAFTYVY